MKTVVIPTARFDWIVRGVSNMHCVYFKLEKSESKQPIENDGFP